MSSLLGVLLCVVSNIPYSQTHHHQKPKKPFYQQPQSDRGNFPASGIKVCVCVHQGHLHQSYSLLALVSMTHERVGASSAEREREREI